MIILSIETSCDDTGVALLDVGKGQIKILADFVSSQTAIHAPFGGVVPNLATRAHYKNLPILLEKVLGKINPRKVDLIAATNGPGLEPCLWAGVNMAKVLAKALDKPLVGVNHLEGHIAANFVGGNSKFEIRNSKFLFPIISLIVSGGHTQLVLMKDVGKYKILGQTRDDAAGEAFDKVAKMLGLKYPGGPEIALNAKNGDSKAFELPRPMIDSKDYDFSFSGLKTAVRYLWGGMDSRFPPAMLCKALRAGRGNDKKESGNDPSTGSGHSKREGGNSKIVSDICASFQQAAIDVLVAKTIKAAIEYNVKTIMLAGGVAANKELQKQMKTIIKKQIPGSRFLVPDSRYCADNAAMIGLAGYWKYMRQGKGDKIEKIVAEANLNL